MSPEELGNLAKSTFTAKKREILGNYSPKNLSYIERLEYELIVVDLMGFNGYFVIVSDFINWAKAHDIPVGP
jgi:DNA polymerase III alpha subunit